MVCHGRTAALLSLLLLALIQSSLGSTCLSGYYLYKPLPDSDGICEKDPNVPVAANVFRGANGRPAVVQYSTDRAGDSDSVPDSSFSGVGYEGDLAAPL